MEKPQMISIAGLKARGWTQALITLLGEPDVVRRNSHYAKLAPMRLYDTARVASFEVSSESLQKRKLLGVSAEQRLPWRQSARH